VEKAVSLRDSALLQRTVRSDINAPQGLFAWEECQSWIQVDRSLSKRIQERGPNVVHEDMWMIEAR